MASARSFTGSAARALAVGALLASGCIFDAGAPGTTPIRCQRESECPPEMACRFSVGLCLPTAPPETNPPFLEAQLVSPAIGSFGVPFLLQFRVSEPLLVEPRVRVVGSNGAELGGVERTRIDGEGDLDFSFRYVAPAPGAPSAPEGTTRALVELIDRVGNEASRLEIGAFTLDFTPPRVVAQTADVVLVPSANLPVASISALGPTSTVRVSFGTDEPLVDAGVRSSIGALELLAAGGETTTWVFTGRLAPDAGAIDTEVTLEVFGADLAGNAIAEPRLQLRPGLRVDTVPPAAPAVDLAGAIRFYRAPYGELPSTPPHSELTGLAGSIEPLAEVQVREPFSDSVLARTVAGATGAFGPVALGAADRPRVLVSAVDAAGNESPRARVRDVTWVGTLRERSPGSTLGNQSRLELQPLFTPAAVSALALEVGPAALPGGPARSGGFSWARRGRPPPNLSCGAMAPHHARSTTLAFDGYELFEWNGHDWARLPVADPEGDGNPICPSGTQLGVDEGRDQVVLACDQGLPMNWVYDGRSWRSLGYQNVSPPRGLAYWPQRARLVGAAASGELYEWNGGAWEIFAAAGAQLAAATVWRAANGVLGVDQSGQTLFFDGGAWLPIGDAGTAAQRSGLTLAAGPGGGTVWLAQRQADGGVDLADWTGSGWRGRRVSGLGSAGQTLCPLPLGADPRGGRVLVGNPVNSRIVAALADGGLELVSDPSRVAPPGLQATAAWNEAEDTVLVLAPSAAADELVAAAWNGNLWSPRAALPSARAYPRLAWDPARGGVLAVGGALRDGGLSAQTALFLDGGWVDLSAQVGPAPPAYGGGFALCPFAGGHVYVGGLTTPSAGWASPAWNAAWRLPDDGGSWQPYGGTVVPARGLSQLHYNDRTGWCELGPGVSAGGSTNSLLALIPANAASGSWLGGQSAAVAAGAYALAFDPTLGFAVATGGVRVQGGAPISVPSDLYRYYAAYLAPVLVDPEGDGNPGWRYDAAMVFDPARQTLVLLGGERSLDGGTAGGSFEIWETAPARERPAAVFSVDLGQAAIPPGAAMVALEVDAQLFGSGPASDGGQLTGATLALHRHGQWAPLATLDAGLNTVAVADAALLESALSGQRWLRLAAVPVATNGPATALIRVYRLEARVGYRLP